MLTTVEKELLVKRIKIAQDASTLLDNDPTGLLAQTAAAYSDILDEILVDIAQEVHRDTRHWAVASGAQPSHRDSTAQFEPNAASTSSQQAWPVPPAPPLMAAGKGRRDVFGQSHPPVAIDNVLCKVCGREMAAGRFAPHLSKCLGKGRSAARHASRRIQRQAQLN